MNKRSKKAWLENVAWGLVVSMSVLQLTSGWQWRAAQAGQFDCWTSRLTDRVVVECGKCDGGCQGEWREVDSYEYCQPARNGAYECKPLPGWWNNITRGQEGDCVSQFSFLGMVVCFGGGAAGGLSICMPACAWAVPAGPAAFGSCVAGCSTGVGVAVAVTCCTTTCNCVKRCVPSVARAVKKQKVELTRPGCRSINVDEGG